MQANNRVFTVRICGALEINFWKSAKSRNRKPAQSLRRDRIHLVEDANGFEDHVADDFQALGTQLVYCILRRVPEDVVVTIVKIDQIGRRDTSLHERNVIIANLVLACEKVRLVTKAFCRLADN